MTTEPESRPESWRTFVAIPLPPEIQKTLVDLQKALPDQHQNDVRWVAPESIHLTMRFLGATDPAIVPDIIDELEEAASTSGKFQLRLAGTGTFPARGRPKVIWVGVDGEVRRLERLRSRVQGALARVGIDEESRPFEPHLTVGRIRNESSPPWDFRAAAAFQQLEIDSSQNIFEVDCVTFFRSHLDQTGARYEVLSESKLK